MARQPAPHRVDLGLEARTKIGAVVLLIAGGGIVALMAALSRAKTAAQTQVQATPYVVNLPASPFAWLTPEVYAAAKKWATARGLPLQWVLATIQVESSGNPRAHASTANEDSYGYMQLNWGSSAIRSLAESYGVTTPDRLMDPDTNIMLGTLVLRTYLDNVLSWLGGAPPPAPLDQIVRLAYKGPALVKSALAAGKTDPSTFYKNAGQAVQNWNVAMTKASAVA
jgi:hypothetical protein